MKLPNPKRIAAAVFRPIPVTRTRALGMSERLAALTALGSSLEYLTQQKQNRRGGLNDWTVLKDSYFGSSPFTQKLMNAVSGERTTVALHTAQAAVGAAMLLPGNSRWRGAGSLFLSATGALLYPRHRYGTDGSDQVAILVQAANGAARLSKDTRTQDALLWYVALQANLSYLVSGWVKLLGEPWRDASALGGVMRTRTYGHEPTYKLVKRYPVAAKYLTHGVLALECLFPVAYLAGGRLARPVIATAGAFHVANGFVMGLGRFVTAFTSMHPMVAYTSAPKSHPAAAGRDDRAPVAAAALLAGAAGIGAAVAVQRRLRTRDGWPGSRRLTTRHGNHLQYETGGGNGSAPVLVFAAGMASTSEHFAWITEKIVKETGYGVLSYARAGYAGSDRGSTAPYDLAESADDLVDMIAGVVPAHRKVVLVGHSLGGEIARRAAAQLGDRLQGIVYLDSSHPDELNRSEAQRESGSRLGQSLDLIIWSLRLGMGIFMAHPEWIASLPLTYRKRVFAQYTDARMWVAAKREWDAVEADFSAFSGSLAPVEGDALVISAHRSVDQSPEQLEMHGEIADAHRAAGRLVESWVVPGSDHDSLLTDSRYALPVADRIIAFAAGSPVEEGTGPDQGSGSMDESPSGGTA
ncbi:alpha/beta fold hydrolase [Streptomyces erythrochromogenes]|uniref:alpha/beta fold hydrolase n=1 Tax=Streptomyces erythrochromogenes TaxID=285574 RepID=UPI003443998E